MALYTYDEEADVLYVLFGEEQEASIRETVELSPYLHVDLDRAGEVVGVELAYPRTADVDLAPLRERFGVTLEVPFSFAA